MKPIVKWPGGKDRELKYFSHYFPNKCRKFIDPFVGGGSVIAYAANNDLAKDYIFNDFSDDLYNLYDVLINNFTQFSRIVREIDEFKVAFDPIAVEKSDTIDIHTMFIDGHCVPPYYLDIEEILKEFVTYKNRRLNKLAKNDIHDSESRLKAIETAFHGALYTCIRKLYNRKSKDPILSAFYFFYIREFCYSSMFRFNAKGEFNVPYGGYGYNSKVSSVKINNIANIGSGQYNLKIYNEDFQDFLNSIDITSEDFIFLDPPYDSEFSDYDNNVFGREDQIRLRDFLLDTEAKIMVVIKETEFINSLYKEDFKISIFDKKYSVNFQNRNNREVKHLIITNY